MSDTNVVDFHKNTPSKCLEQLRQSGSPYLPVDSIKLATSTVSLGEKQHVNC